MSLVSSFKHDLIRTFTNRSRPGKLESGEWFYPLIFSKDFSKIDFIKAFLIPEVNAIFNKRASAHANMKLEVVSKKTQEPVQNNLSKLLKQPNWFQSTKEYLKQTNIFHDIYGNEYNYAFFGVGLDPKRTKAMYSLVPAFMEVKYKDEERYYKTTEVPENLVYEYTFDNTKDDISPEQIIHLNDNRVAVKEQSGTLLTGQSKLQSLARPLNNIIGAYQSRGILIWNRGAIGILSNESSDVAGVVPVEDDEKEKLRKEYSGYGLTENQFQIIITNSSLRWQQMSQKVGDLKLFEEVQEDYIKIAEAYNYPPELLPRTGTPNLFGDNKTQSEKAWYQNSIIPEAQERIDAFNLFFKTEKESYTIAGRFDHLPIFREDQMKKAQVLALVTNSLSRQFQDQAISLEEYQAQIRELGFTE